MFRIYLKIAALANTALEASEKCGVARRQTPCKLRFFDRFRLVLPALANFAIDSRKLTKKAIFFVALITSVACRAADGEVTLIHIGDLHGHLIPRPDQRDGSVTKGQRVGGLASLYARIEEIRRRNVNHLLINTGDTLQGSAEALFTKGEALVEILNGWRIDVFVPGNWDFLYGTERFRELFAGSAPRANWHALAANLYYTTLSEYPETPYAKFAGQRVVAPYVVKKVGNLKIGVIGLTADRGPQSVSPLVTAGFFLSPGEEELKEAVDLLRRDEKVDLLVLASERGLAANLDLVERVPGVDFVLSSDSHEETRRPLRAKTGTILVEEGQDGVVLGELHVVVKGGRRVDWRWNQWVVSSAKLAEDKRVAAVVKKIRSRFVKGDDFVPHVNPINGAILRTPVDTVVGYTRVALHRSNFSDDKNFPAVIEGTSHDFLSEAFRSGCNGEVGVMRGFRYGTHVPPGPVTLEDIYHYIPIGPQIACGGMTGDELRWQIEKSVDSVLTRWVGNWGGGWISAYAGIEYDLDPGNEYGFRVSNLRINGESFDPARQYRVAGYWYVDDANRINRSHALDIRVLKDQNQGVLDAVDVVAFYLQSLPDKTVTGQPPRIRLVERLPKKVGVSGEIQPIRGVPRAEY